jgi:hypothetical protein
MMKHTLCKLSVLAMLFAVPAVGDTIDFTQLPIGDLGSRAVTVDGVTFDGALRLYNASQLYFGHAGGAICASEPDPYDCTNDLTVKFNGKVKRLALEAAAFDPGDPVTISVYRGKQILGTASILPNGPVNLRSFGRVTKLVFDDNDTGHGCAYGMFKFKRLTTSAKHDQDGEKRHSGKFRRARTP